MPTIKLNSSVQLGSDKFVVHATKGEGGFAKVYSATRESEDGLNSTIAGIDAVLKVTLVYFYYKL